MCDNDVRYFLLVNIDFCVNTNVCYVSMMLGRDKTEGARKTLYLSLVLLLFVEGRDDRRKFAGDRRPPW